MSDREDVERIVREWAELADIPDTQASLCDVWKAGGSATSAPCDEALEDLVERLRAAFSDRGLDLEPKDFDGTVRHVDDLVTFVMIRQVTNAIGRTLFATATAEPRISGASSRSLDAVIASIVGGSAFSLPVATLAVSPSASRRRRKNSVTAPATPAKKGGGKSKRGQR